MKQLRDEMKSYQKQMKELRNNPQKMMEVQKLAMQSNMKYMMHSMRSTLVTFIPIILIFGWMNAHFAYEPIHANQEFNVSLNFLDNSVGEVTLSSPEDIAINGDALKKIENNQVSYNLASKKEGE